MSRQERLGDKLNPGELNRRIEIWGKQKYTNEMYETDYKDVKVSTVWAKIIPQTGSLIKQSNAGTLLSNVTHKVIMRYNSAKNLKTDNWLMYFEKDADRQAYLNNTKLKAGHRLDIKYLLDPYYKHETMEIFCVEETE